MSVPMAFRNAKHIGNRESSLRVYEFASSKDCHSLHPCSIKSVALIFLGDGSCLVWNIQDPLDRVSKLTGPELDGITSLRKVGGKIYSSCKDGGVRVYNIADMH